MGIGNGVGGIGAAEESPGDCGGAGEEALRSRDSLKSAGSSSIRDIVWEKKYLRALHA